LEDLESFRSIGQRRLSEYFDDLGDEQRTKAIYFDLQEMFPGRCDSLVESRVGCPPSITVAGKSLNYNDLNLIYFALSIEELILKTGKKAEDPLRILEIGGGYGGLTSKLAKIFPNSFFVACDLPQSLIVTSYYLAQLHGVRTIAQINESHSCTVNEGYMFNLVVSSNKEALKSLTFDLIINTRSLMEMSKTECADWLSFINKHLKTGGVFYQANRYLKNTSGWANRIKDYKYGNNWSILLSRPLPFQKHIHELGLIKTEKIDNMFAIQIQQLPKRAVTAAGETVHLSEILPRFDYWARIVPIRLFSKVKRLIQTWT
jgi:putative sugar O-methyltransferase